MGYYCTVPQCTSLAGKTKNVKFHRFPRDSMMADKWNKILKRGKPYTQYSKVCSLHFTQSDYNITTMGQWKTLSKDAVPSQNLPKLNPDGTLMVIRKSRTIRYVKSSPNKKDDNSSEGPSKSSRDKWSHMAMQTMPHSPTAGAHEEDSSSNAFSSLHPDASGYVEVYIDSDGDISDFNNSCGESDEENDRFNDSYIKTGEGNVGLTEKDTNKRTEVTIKQEIEITENEIENFTRFKEASDRVIDVNVIGDVVRVKQEPMDTDAGQEKSDLVGNEFVNIANIIPIVKRQSNSEAVANSGIKDEGTMTEIGSHVAHRIDDGLINDDSDDDVADDYEKLIEETLKKRTDDPCSVFGKHVANEIRKFDKDKLDQIKDLIKSVINSAEGDV